MHISYHGNIAWEEHRQHSIFTHATSNKLSILRAIVQDQAYRVLAKNAIHFRLGLFGRRRTGACHRQNTNGAQSDQPSGSWRRKRAIPRPPMLKSASDKNWPGFGGCMH